MLVLDNILLWRCQRIYGGIGEYLSDCQGYKENLKNSNDMHLCQFSSPRSLACEKKKAYNGSVYFKFAADLKGISSKHKEGNFLYKNTKEIYIMFIGFAYFKIQELTEIIDKPFVNQESKVDWECNNIEISEDEE
ncbi:hypothetical protein RhiirA5_477682 [Rhizophagus irregularis]|uniref:Uncharacterized protein n=1 Tax=Rhizophagus irregularis TaxID=588596 RepID=A0A2I1F574_9GLOM|nr:hypothetical protein RhiirA5_477682 [Rhizophagus irregularis]PKY29532.1 hypothetical protein RhiirB3_391888 [Rhizophagus irregularis]